MAQPDTAGYTVDDLLWLRNELSVPARLELDPWGNLIVSPVTDEHELAIALLNSQAVRQLGLPPGFVWTGFTWRVPGGTGYYNRPDLTVLHPEWRRIDDWHADPPPLLVVEVASPSTARIDRTRKLDDYRLGGAGLYVRVDFFGPGKAGFEVYDLVSGAVSISTGAVDLIVDGRPLRFDLRDLPVTA